MEEDFVTRIVDLINAVRKTGGANERESSIVAAVIVAEAIGQASTDIVNALDGIHTRLEEIRDKLNGVLP